MHLHTTENISQVDRSRIDVRPELLYSDKYVPRSTRGQAGSIPMGDRQGVFPWVIGPLQRGPRRLGLSCTAPNPYAISTTVLILWKLLLLKGL